MTASLLRKNGYTLILINALPHVKFKTELFIGFDSYIDKEGAYLYHIRMYVGGMVIPLEYEDGEVWEEVLKVLI